MSLQRRRPSLTAGASASAGTDRSESAGRADEQPGDPAGVHTGADRTGSFPTRENLTLQLSTDLGTVKITALPAGAAPVLRYTAHIETDAREPLADRLLSALFAEGGSDAERRGDQRHAATADREKLSGGRAILGDV